jgi:hypothetical protein
MGNDSGAMLHPELLNDSAFGGELAVFNQIRQKTSKNEC